MILSSLGVHVSREEKLALVGVCCSGPNVALGVTIRGDGIYCDCWLLVGGFKGVIGREDSIFRLSEVGRPYPLMFGFPNEAILRGAGLSTVGWC